MLDARPEGVFLFARAWSAPAQKYTEISLSQNIFTAIGHKIVAKRRSLLPRIYAHKNSAGETPHIFGPQGFYAVWSQIGHKNTRVRARSPWRGGHGLTSQPLAQHLMERNFIEEKQEALER